MTIDPEWNGLPSEGRAIILSQRNSKLLRDTIRVLGILMVAVGVLSVGAQLQFTLNWSVSVLAISMFTCISAFVVNGLHSHPFDRFGAANVITAFRGGLAVVVGAVVLTSENIYRDPSQALIWALFTMTLMSVALDGVDGYMARRTGRSSTFGARFDMEVDALLIFFLSLAAFAMSKAGVWVILSGAMRYGFVALQLLMPRLRGELVPSFRRKLVCVIQVAVLCVLLVPFVSGQASNLLALGALALLSWSFAIDLVDLYRRSSAAK